MAAWTVRVPVRIRCGSGREAHVATIEATTAAEANAKVARVLRAVAEIMEAQC